MARVYNFSAGPSMLPEDVLKTAAAEMMEYGETGQSVMEMSHRSKEYQAIFDETEKNLREIMNIPDNYDVLFLQGGASTQFAMVPLNLMTKNGKADYIITGQWANKAYKEAARYGKARAVATSADKTFSYIPKTTRADFDPEADYVHICMNNTSCPIQAMFRLWLIFQAAYFQSLSTLQNSAFCTRARRKTLLPPALPLL